MPYLSSVALGDFKDRPRLQAVRSGNLDRVAVVQPVAEPDEEPPEEMRFSERFACIDCQRSFEELQPRLFSFNTPYGACPDCMGLGTSSELDDALIIPDARLTINEGAILPWRSLSSRYHKALLRAGGGVADVWPSVGVLTGLGLVLLPVGSLLMKRRLERGGAA